MTRPSRFSYHTKNVGYSNSSWKGKIWNHLIVSIDYCNFLKNLIITVYSILESTQQAEENLLKNGGLLESFSFLLLRRSSSVADCWQNEEKKVPGGWGLGQRMQVESVQPETPLKRMSESVFIELSPKQEPDPSLFLWQCRRQPREKVKKKMFQRLLRFYISAKTMTGYVWPSHYRIKYLVRVAQSMAAMTRSLAFFLLLSYAWSSTRNLSADIASNLSRYSSWSTQVWRSDQKVQCVPVHRRRQKRPIKLMEPSTVRSGQTTIIGLAIANIGNGNMSSVLTNEVATFVETNKQTNAWR